MGGGGGGGGTRQRLQPRPSDCGLPLAVQAQAARRRPAIRRWPHPGGLWANLVGLTLAAVGAGGPGGYGLALASLVLLAAGTGGPDWPLRFGPAGHGAADSGGR